VDSCNERVQICKQLKSTSNVRLIIEIHIDNKYNRSIYKDYLCPLDPSVVKADLGGISVRGLFKSHNVCVHADKRVNYVEFIILISY